MRTITTRLDRLEQRRGNKDQRRAQTGADAAWVAAKIEGLATVARGHGIIVTPADQQRWKQWSAGFVADAGRAA